jgi:hypothetical protein
MGLLPRPFYKKLTPPHRRNLSSVNDRILKEQLGLLCGYCGHLKENYKNKTKRITEEATTISWRQAYDRYKKGRPELPLY